MLEFNWELHPCLTNVAPDHWRGEYFESPDLTGDFTGNAAVIRDEGQRDLELSFARNFTGRINTMCLTREAFTARFTRKVTFGAGTYKFTLTSYQRHIDSHSNLWGCFNELFYYCHKHTNQFQRLWTSNGFDHQYKHGRNLWYTN